MRERFRPGLEGDGFGYVDEAVAGGQPTRKPKGYLIIPASRNDLKFLFDQQIFSYDMKKTEPIHFVVKHTKCGLPNNLIVRYTTDRPKHYLHCGLCFKKWEFYQLEVMRPQDFSSTFEYLWTPKEKWPYMVYTVSNGVTKYTRTNIALISEAAEYYYKEFIAFKNNGFKWSQQ